MKRRDPVDANLRLDCIIHAHDILMILHLTYIKLPNDAYVSCLTIYLCSDSHYPGLSHLIVYKCHNEIIA